MSESEDQGSLNINETLALLLGFVTRRKWWILIPGFIMTLGTVVAVRFLPNRYESSATLMVVQQQVPQRFVLPNNTVDKASALESVKQEILSRARLLKMINDFGLYPKERKRMAPEALVELMLGNIDVVPIINSQRDLDSFKISFTTENAVLAQQVTNNLTSLFINDYMRTGAEQATYTTNFLNEQADVKAKELQAHEERLRDFKLRYVGELPEQQQSTQSILNGLQGQLQGTMAGLNRAEQQRSLLQAQLDSTTRRRQTTVGTSVQPVSTDPATARFQTQLETAQKELSQLESAKAALIARGYTANHYDVLKAQRQIAMAQEALTRLRASAPPEVHRAATPAAPDSSVTDDPALAQLTTSLEANRLEIEGLRRDESQLKTRIKEYENRLNQMPVREQQLAGLARDTESLRQQYSKLQDMEQQAQLSTNLEKKQGGQQFRLIDPASLPAKPFSPKRFKMTAMGAFAGFALGAVFALLLELRDTSFRREKELIQHLNPPFVLGIPVLATLAEERKERWSARLEWAGASALVFVVLLAEFYVYRHG